MQKYTSVQLEAKTELSNRCSRAQVEVCMHAPISYSEECIKNNTMTITRDIIRVFYHTIMSVCSTVYIHLYWVSQKTESIILGSCFCWDHLQLGNSIGHFNFFNGSAHTKLVDKMPNL